MAHIKTPNDVLFLAEASRLYEDQCPELSRFLMQKAHAVTEDKSGEQDARRKDGGPVPVLYACQYCRQRFKPDNHRVRLRPKKRPAARVQSVLRREAWGKRLSLAQRELLRRFRGSSSVLGNFPIVAINDKAVWLCALPNRNPVHSVVKVRFCGGPTANHPKAGTDPDLS
ncbi:unnamed protein product [Merluccius merluccius]